MRLPQSEDRHAVRHGRIGRDPLLVGRPAPRRKRPDEPSRNPAVVPLCRHAETPPPV